MNAIDPFDPKYDDPTPAPETIGEFVSGLGGAFSEAREAGAALEALRAFVRRTES